MDLKKILEQVRDIGTISIEDLMDLTKKFDCRKVIVAIHLVNERLITAEEAKESLEKEDRFFIASNN